MGRTNLPSQFINCIYNVYTAKNIYMEKFNEILDILKNRRVISSIIGGIVFVMMIFNIHSNINIDSLSDIVLKVVSATGDLIAALLSLHSFLYPKAQ